MATITAPNGPAGRSWNARRRIGRLLIVTAAVPAAVGLAVINFGDLAARSRDPVLLAHAAAFSFQSATLVAEAELAAGKAASAARTARHALEGAPLSARALRTLGLAREAQGNATGAAAAMALAGALGWRDTPTQIWLVKAYLQQGDYAAALERTDALARRRQWPEQMDALLMGAALDPDARAALSARLRLDPPWRSAFFESAHHLPAESFGPFAAFLTAFASDGTVRPHEAEGFVANLYGRGEYRRARQMWVLAAVEGEAPAHALFDGGFDDAALDLVVLDLHPTTLLRSVPRSVHPGPFAWTFPQPPGSEVRLGQPPGRDRERALYAGSAGDARYEVARQSLALTPGRYRLQAEASAEPGLRLAGFSWTLECLPDHRALPLIERRASLPDGWTRLAYEVEVPPAGCAGQRLALILRGGETRPIGLWFDRVAISMLGEGSGS